MAFLALAASLTLDFVFFFGARGSSASFTLELFFDRGAGGGHEPPLTASARTGRGRASAATVKAASSARARTIVDASLYSTPRRASLLRVALLVLSVTARAAAATASYDPQAKCAGTLLRFITEFLRLGACLQRRSAQRTNLKSNELASVLLPLARVLWHKALTTRAYYGSENRFELIVIPP